ncbi:hypothetical protein EZS27_041662, partial [termite gut metagenome]
NIWLSTHSGVSKLIPDKNKFITYYAFDGLQGNEFSMGAAFKALIYDNSSEEKIITIIISPPWYLTWWAKFTYLLLFACLIFVKLILFIPCAVFTHCELSPSNI